MVQLRNWRASARAWEAGRKATRQALADNAANRSSRGGLQVIKSSPEVPDVVAEVDVAIVGGGFTGGNLATQLLRLARASGRPVRVAIVEREERLLCRGVAYSSPNRESHVLNFRAANTIALPDDPTGFVRFVSELRGVDAATAGAEHSPRWDFGSYVRKELEDAATAEPSSECTAFEGEAVAVRPTAGGGGAIHISGGSEVRAKKVVLATGNAPPSDPPVPGGALAEHPGYRRDVWEWVNAPPTDVESEPGAAVLLVGSSLTAVDACLELLDRGFGGAIHCVSLTGKLPMAHSSVIRERQPPPVDVRTNPGALECLRAMRAEIARQPHWSSAVDSFRSISVELWQGWPDAEKRRFLRHCRQIYTPHRNRVSLSVSERMEAAVASGKVILSAGRVEKVRADAATVRYADGTAAAMDGPLLILNCTGQNGEGLKHTQSALLRELMATGLLNEDKLGLGFDCVGSGNVVGEDGPSDWLYAAGPVTAGLVWEAISVPDLGVAVGKLAAELMAET